MKKNILTMVVILLYIVLLLLVTTGNGSINSIDVNNNNITYSNTLTNNKVLYIDNSGKLATSQITSDELLQLKNEVELLKQQQNNMKTQLDSLYPVGSIYISINSTDPATFLGGVWEKISGKSGLNYYPAFASSTDNGGEIISESLPNIIGYFQTGAKDYISTQVGEGFALYGMGQNDNAFVGHKTSGSVITDVDGNYRRYDSSTYANIAHFDASRTNNIYQNDAHVNVNAIKLFFWKRIQ